MQVTAELRGKLISCHSAEYIDKSSGEVHRYAKAQFLQRDENKFFRIAETKIDKKQIDELVDPTSKLLGKDVSATLYLREFNGKTSYYLSDVPLIDASAPAPTPAKK